MTHAAAAAASDGGVGVVPARGQAGVTWPEGAPPAGAEVPVAAADGASGGCSGGGCGGGGGRRAAGEEREGGGGWRG